jgi:hypothetical protein
VQMSNGLGGNKYIFSFAANGNNIFTGTGNISGVYVSQNNGTSWVQTSLNDEDILSLAVYGNNSKDSGQFIFAGSYLHGVFISSNNGTNWIQTSLNNKAVFSLAINDNFIFAGTMDSGVFKSLNNGSTWTRTALSNNSVHSLVINAGIIFAGTNNGIYKSTNNGSNWSLIGFYNTGTTSIAANENIICAGTMGSGVYISTNNGYSWSQTALNDKDIYSLALSGNKIIAGTSDSGIYLSTNNGVNWIQKNQGFSSLQSIWSLFIYNNYLFAGTGLTVWRRSLSEIIGMQISFEDPISFYLGQNYPNPFNSTTHINFEIPESSYVKLIIYDYLGKEITTLADIYLEPAKYIIDWKAGNYPSGVYFYRMETEKFTETKKLILLK